ncbi:MAG TPA: DUF4349 domain-containing protein [Candidatus Angelobacter sp.]|nr:DUF4349 domain-containing protein [Candidatus Angelobacter sp.]
MLRRNSHAVDELELMAYLDGELPRERAAAAATHLETCRECQAMATDLRGVSQELAAWQVEPSDLKLSPRISALLEVHARTQEEKPGRRVRTGLRLRRRVVVWGIVSGAVALILIAVATPNLMRSKLAANMARMQGQEQPGSLGFRDSLGTLNGYTSSVREREQAQASQTTLSNEDINIPSGPMVIRTAELALTATDFDQTRSKLEDILKRHHGYLGELSVSGGANAARALSATLRVPADQLDATIAELKKLGHVDSESQKGEEVSQQYVDLRARLANARTTEQTLLDILRHRTGKLSDVLAVEQEVASVREKIERMEAEKKSLEKQVAFSTLNMRVVEDYKQQVHVVPESTSRRIRNAAVDGYETMVAGLINVLLFLVSAGPSLLLWAAVLFFPVRFAWKKWRSRNRI